MQSWQSTMRSAETWPKSTLPRPERHAANQGLEATVERFRFFNEVLEGHAHGEELAVFPALEGVAPLVAEAYEEDHRGLDAAFDSLSKAVSARDALGTARAPAAFKFHLDIHLHKEEMHLYFIIKERVPVPDQAAAAGVMAGSVPAERKPELIAWMFPLLGDDDRENMTRVWPMVMPPQVFGGAIQLVQRAIGDDFAELTRRISGLAA
jgi:hemerythrin HHE cation binding domain-containing protein